MRRTEQNPGLNAPLNEVRMPIPDVPGYQATAVVFSPVPAEEQLQDTQDLQPLREVSKPPPTPDQELYNFIDQHKEIIMYLPETIERSDRFQVDSPELSLTPTQLAAELMPLWVKILPVMSDKAIVATVHRGVYDALSMDPLSKRGKLITETFIDFSNAELKRAIEEGRINPVDSTD